MENPSHPRLGSSDSECNAQAGSICLAMYMKNSGAGPAICIQPGLQGSLQTDVRVPAKEMAAPESPATEETAL